MKDLLQHWVAVQASRRPDAGALVFNKERVSYGALDEASNRLANLLREAGCARGDRVCLLCPKSPIAIVAILAVLKADAIYVPLDPASPPARLEKMISSCDTPWILASGAVGATLQALFANQEFARTHILGWLGDGSAPQGVPARFTKSQMASASHRTPPMRSTPSDPAHILFTSGSTGTPKGVVITHANVRAFIRWAVSYFGTRSTDRISGHPPLHFDLSTFDIFGTFAAGAELHLVPPELSLVPHRLAEMIRDAGLTQWFSVPSALNYMAKFDVLELNGFPALQRVLWCGEVLPIPTLVYWMERLPHVRFTNLYGPTETTIASSHYTVPERPASDDVIPIGRACDGEELLVLDDALQPVAPDTLGNLYVGGAGLSPGYWRDPEKTRQAFVEFNGTRIYRTGDLATLGADGLVRYAGRADSQVKSRGYRVELGEVEAALNLAPGLRECAVVAVPTGDFDGVAICCAYVPADPSVASPATLRATAARALPPYMVPTRWVALDEFPRTPSGKIDRNRLKESFQPSAVAAS